MQSNLKFGNQAFLKKQYDDAIDFYQNSLKEMPGLYKCLSLNIKLANKKSSGSFVDTTNNLTALLQGEKNQLLDFLPINAERLDAVHQSFKAIAKDPLFLLDNSAQCHFEKGWYEIQVEISCTLDSEEAKIYIDYGEGFSEIDCESIFFKSSILSSRILFFKRKPKRIRFDPVASISNFQISDLVFKRLDFNSAKRKIYDFIDQKIPDAKLNIPSFLNLSDESIIEAYEGIYRPFFCVEYYQYLNYLDWIKRIEEPRFPSEEVIRNNLSLFKKQPLLSILIPTYNSDLKFLHECINSILNQTYKNWELCIADDASTNGEVRAMLSKFASEDSRIKLEFRKINGHISEASNSALKLASGEYVLLVDHDDLLAKEALYFVIEKINQSPQAQVIYSDEDKIDEEGKRYDPHFKGGFNLDQLYSNNYISHLGIYKRSLLNQISGFRKGYEGAQDYDLLLRCLTSIDYSEVAHIPRILYHWRASINSTALNSKAKTYTNEAGIKALRSYFEINNPKVIISHNIIPNTYRVHWPILDHEPLVSLIIPTRDRLDLLKVCVDSILKNTTYKNYEILIVDNDSVEDDTLNYLNLIQSMYPNVKVLHSGGEFNYSQINNWAAHNSNGEILGLINNDIEVISPDWLTEMVSQAIRPDIGCVGAKLYYPDSSIQHAGVIVGMGGIAGHGHSKFPEYHPGYFGRLAIVQNFSAVTAACLIVKKKIFNDVGGLDDKNLKVAFNDVDLCLKVMELGYRNLWTPYAELYHHESLSRGADDTAVKQERFNSEINYMKEKWGEKLLHDKYYNRNLTLQHSDYSLNYTDC